MKQPKLKIGDKVKVIDITSSFYGGKGKIIKNNEDDLYNFVVYFDKEFPGSLFKESELQLITPKQKSKWKLTRKELWELWFDGKYVGKGIHKLGKDLMAKQSQDKEEVKNEDTKTVLISKKDWIKATCDIKGKFYCPIDMQRGLLDVWPERTFIEINKVEQPIKSKEIEKIKYIKYRLGMTTIEDLEKQIFDIWNKQDELIQEVNKLKENK